MLMQVSAKESTVVASRPSIAQAVVQHTSNDRVSAAKLAKLLGTDTVGGSRRSTAGFRKRLADLSGRVRRPIQGASEARS